MWNDEVIAMGRKTEHGRGGASSSYGVARRVELAADAMRALQQEITECPPVAREILGCRDMLLGIACAINLGDQQCLREACEVVVRCAQECSLRAGDAVVGCPSLLNGLCRKAMQTEDPTVIDTLTALAHQNEKMLWIVTTIIKVMRVERQCEAGLLRRFVTTWILWSRQKGRAWTKDALLSAGSSSSSINMATATKSAQNILTTTRVCDVDDFYLQTISARRFLHSCNTKATLVQHEPQTAMTRDSMFAPSQSIASFVTRQDSMDSVPRPAGMQLSSLYSSWNTASTPLYSTFNGAGEKDMALATQFGLIHELNSTASSLSLPSPEDSCSTFTSVKSVGISKDDDQNPQNIMAMADRLMNRSQNLNSEVEILRFARALPEPKILPERQWTPQGQNIVGVQMTVPSDSLLFASRSSNVSPLLYCSFNGTNPQPAQDAQPTVWPVPFALKGAEFKMHSSHNQDDAVGLSDNLNFVAQTHFRSMAVRERASNYERQRERARTSSAPPSFARSEPSSVSIPVKKAFCGAEVAQTLRPARRELSPPRYLTPITVNSARAIPAAEIRGASTIQVPTMQGGYQSVCDVDNLYAYFSRGRAPTRNPPAQPATYSFSVRSTSPYRTSAAPVAPTSEVVARPFSPLTPQSVLPSPNMRPITLNERATSPQRAELNQQFHKVANEFAFQFIGVGARMLRDESPPRSAPASDVRSPVMRSIVGASTIQVANFVHVPSNEHTGTPFYSNLPYNQIKLSPRRAPSPLPQSNVEICDVDETPMRPALVGYTSPTAKANDWVGVVHADQCEIPRTLADQDDDWC